MDNMLEMYLYETNTLLEQLDELLIEAEKNEDFTTNDVNEIFRIMHTIKGSSAMMEFSPLMEIAHHIEDLFFYIRENGLDAMNKSHKNDLFNLMFSQQMHFAEKWKNWKTTNHLVLISTMLLQILIVFWKKSVERVPQETKKQKLLLNLQQLMPM